MCVCVLSVSSLNAGSVTGLLIKHLMSASRPPRAVGQVYRAVLDKAQQV